MASKSCTKCKKSKSLTEFAKDKSAKDGLNRKCRDCQRAYFREYTSSRRLNPTNSMKGKTDISALLEFSRVDDRLVKLTSEARMIFKTYMLAYNTGTPLDKAMAENGIERSMPFVHGIISELREAAKNGLSLEDYFRNGRPYKKRVVDRVLLSAKER